MSTTTYTWGAPASFVEMTEWGAWEDAKGVVKQCGNMTLSACARRCYDDPTCISSFAYLPNPYTDSNGKGMTVSANGALLGTCVTETNVSGTNTTPPPLPSMSQLTLAKNADSGAPDGSLPMAIVGGAASTTQKPKGCALSASALPSAPQGMKPCAAGTQADGGIIYADGTDARTQCEKACDAKGTACTGFVVDQTNSYCRVLGAKDTGGAATITTKVPTGSGGGGADADPNRYYTWLKPVLHTEGPHANYGTVSVNGKTFRTGRWRSDPPNEMLMWLVILGAIMVGMLGGWGAYKVAQRERWWGRPTLAEALQSGLGADADGAAELEARV